MPNIVYALTNSAMPGFVKIGMTDRPDVQRRMDELYSTGVPFPFDCAIAWEIEGREATEIESALHEAFAPYRKNPSREFFQVEPEQVQAVLRVIPGRDVTPQDTDQSAEFQADDRQASTEFERHQSRTNEIEFLESLNENGRVVYERVLSLGNQPGVKVKWNRKGFSLNVVSSKGLAAICQGYPPLAYNQAIHTAFDSVERNSKVPSDVVEKLKAHALDTGLFAPMGSIGNLACRTDRSWDESKLVNLTGWMTTVVERVREFETVDPDDADE